MQFNIYGLQILNAINIDGECINGTSAPSLLGRLQSGPLTVILDDEPSVTSRKVAPICPFGRAPQEMKGCKCADGPVTKGLDGNPRVGCIPHLA